MIGKIGGDYSGFASNSVFVRREFKIELREDPSSVFASDIVIENSNGPIDYDLSRIYTGKLEGESKDAKRQRLLPRRSINFSASLNI